MIQTLRLHNFKTFDEETFSIAPLTLIMGINGMGKSSILQSLLLLKQNYANGSFDMKDKQVRLEGDFVSLEDSQSLCNVWSDDRKVEIDITLSDKATVCWTINAEEEDKSDLPCEMSSDNGDVRSLFSEGFAFLGANRLMPHKDYSTVSRKTYNTKLGTEGELTPGYLHQALNKNEEIGIDAMKCPNVEGIDLQLVTNVNAWMSKIMNISMAATTEPIDSQRVRIIYNIGDVLSEPFSPLQVGFGLTYTLPVVTALLMAKPNDLLLMENPEAHLHPSAQVKLGEMISKAVACGVQVIIETHSDHIINGVRLARKNGIIGKQSDVNLIFVQRTKDEDNNKLITYVNDVQIKDDGKFTEPLPDMFNTWTDTLVKLV